MFADFTDHRAIAQLVSSVLTGHTFGRAVIGSGNGVLLAIVAVAVAED